MSVTYKLYDHIQDEPLATLSEDEMRDNDSQSMYEQLWEDFKERNINSLYHVWMHPDKEDGWTVVLSYDGDNDEALERPLSSLESDMSDRAGLLEEMVQIYYDQEHPDFEGMRIVIEKPKRQRTN